MEIRQSWIVLSRHSAKMPIGTFMNNNLTIDLKSLVENNYQFMVGLQMCVYLSLLYLSTIYL